jgi:hypothetical protein
VINCMMARPCVKIQLTDRFGIFYKNLYSNAVTAGSSYPGTLSFPHLGSLIYQLPEVSIITSNPNPNLFLRPYSMFQV